MRLYEYFMIHKLNRWFRFSPPSLSLFLSLCLSLSPCLPSLCLCLSLSLSLSLPVDVSVKQNPSLFLATSIVECIISVIIIEWEFCCAILVLAGDVGCVFIVLVSGDTTDPDVVVYAFLLLCTCDGDVVVVVLGVVETALSFQVEMAHSKRAQPLFVVNL